MSVREHTYQVPTEAELAQMVSAATPHFALQVRDRVASLAATLPPDHPRQAELIAHVVRLEALALGGEAGEEGQAELPARPSLALPAREGADGH